MPTSTKSAAAKRFERQRAEAAAALAAKRMGGAETDMGKPITEQFQWVEPVLATPHHPLGCWPIIDLREAQCRFPCTPHTARPSQHLCCGEPVAWLRGKPTSWCAEHLPVVCGAPGRSAGGTSVADLAAAAPTGGSR